MRKKLNLVLVIFSAIVLTAAIIGILQKHKSRESVNRDQVPQQNSTEPNTAEIRNVYPKIVPDIPDIGNIAGQSPQDLKAQIKNSLLQAYADEERKKYLEGEKFWKEQLKQNPNNFILIRNAARFFIKGDLDLGISTFKRGKSLDDPKNAAVWDTALGEALWLLTIDKENPAMAKEALNAFETAYNEESSDLKRSLLLSKMAKAALASGEMGKTVQYANQMLSSSESVSGSIKGDMIYSGNYLLGMVAVKEEDLDRASKYLLSSADTPGSAALNSFGPDMQLAQELLDRGQSDVVLAFLKKCSKFWNGKTSPCSEWIQEMEEGQKPNFRMKGFSQKGLRERLPNILMLHILP